MSHTLTVQRRAVQRGHLTYVPSTCVAYWKGVAITFTLAENAIMRELIEHDGQWYATPDLCVATAMSPNTLKVMINKIRKKFKKIDPDFDMIQNHKFWRAEPTTGVLAHGRGSFGYRWSSAINPAQSPVTEPA
jgi:DNA-binding response OmpR family regulator